MLLLALMVCLAFCGILATDLVAAFDFLCMDWVFKVLLKKGLDMKVINRQKNLYSESLTIVMVNNIPGGGGEH
jgi:hypothetical protein